MIGDVRDLRYLHWACYLSLEVGPEVRAVIDSSVV
jgi:hypothetical protein